MSKSLATAEAGTSDALIELARFFAVAADSAEMCPMFSSYIDQAWHTLLSTPRVYAQFSREARGKVFKPQASQGEGRISWVSDYETRFGNPPPLWFADATGAVDQTAYAAYHATGEVFHSWDRTPEKDDDDD